MSLRLFSILTLLTLAAKTTPEIVNAGIKMKIPDNDPLKDPDGYLQ